jgi:hypothetical protein
MAWTGVTRGGLVAAWLQTRWSLSDLGHGRLEMTAAVGSKRAKSSGVARSGT